MSEGTSVALELLRLYMTHFRGSRGAWIRAFGSRPAPRAERWDALAGALGLAPAEPGRPVTAGGDGAPAPGIADALVYGEQGWATLQACVYGDDAAAVAARAEPGWRRWMEERFSTTPA